MDDRSDLPGAVVVLLGTFGLLLSLWSSWFTYEAPAMPIVLSEKALERIEATPTLTAFEVFGLTDIALLAVAGAVLVLLLGALLSGWRPLQLVIALLGATAATAIVYSALRPNGLGRVEYVPDLGLLLGLASSAAIAIGGLWAGLARPPRSRRLSARPAGSQLDGYSEHRPVAISATHRGSIPGSGLSPQEQERFLGTGISPGGPVLAPRRPRLMGRARRGRF